MLVLLIVAIALFLQSRRRKSALPPVTAMPASLPAPETHILEDGPSHQPSDAEANLQREVTDLVERQPEEIATLLRGWLADRRSA